jgi:hypothetical protein
MLLPGSFAPQFLKSLLEAFFLLKGQFWRFRRQINGKTAVRFMLNLPSGKCSTDRSHLKEKIGLVESDPRLILPSNKD